MDANELSQLQRRLAEADTFAVADLQQLKGISQPTASRLIAKLRKTGRLLTMGAGKNTRYALTDGSAATQLHIVQADGAVDMLGEYYRLASGASYVAFMQGVPEVLKGAHGNGIYEGALPFFLDDMKPEGFMGIRNAKGFVEHGFPTNLSAWSSEQVLMFLKANSFECKGNILVSGEYALNQLEQERCSIRDYASIANDTLRNYSPRYSSAGGEQPKFTAYRDGVGHVIVKFAQPQLSGIEARRADLLICEHLANQTLGSFGIQTAQTQVLSVDGMLFLESVRFDRVGEAGRLPMLSMMAIDAEYVGRCENWCATAKVLLDMERISSDTYQTIQQLDMFGRLIANTDMHLGNLSFTVSPDGRQFQLLPVYDMLPMAFMPRSDLIPDAVHIVKPAWCSRQMLQAASAFWAQVAEHELVSDTMKNIATKAV